ncbi:MAG TPA: SusC/RagA family TonB-linked outer membrane protein [Flavisolibacter sp.]|nr:SusC/RagA family TonB-linked outer membrane protein [Flavisolibacter sp.]
MRMRLFLLAMFSFLFATNVVHAQAKRTVTGVVRNAEGTALTGATVNEKGTSNNVMTDENGAFSINVSPNATLVVSYAGFTLQEVSAAGTEPIAVVLQPNSSTMNEVVVTGFGIRRETRKLSYSVQEVKGEELARANTPNIVNALQGKVAGVFINQGNGGPMSSSRIRIRGNSSLRPNTQPLVVIDGVIIEPSTTGSDSWGSNSDFGNQMKNLNPDDYESLTVLKGSAASALYGSQAQNGVLVITTKKGRARKGVGVNFSQTFTIDKVYKSIDVQNEFGAGISPNFTKVPVTPGSTDSVFAVDAPNRSWSFGPRFQGQLVRDADGRMITWEPKPNNLIDAFQDAHFRNTYVSLDGASDKGSYRFSYTNTANTYVTPNTDLKRDNFGLRINQRIHRLLNVDASVNYSVTKSKNPLYQGGNNSPLFQMVYFTPRNFDAKYWMENYLDSAGGVNRNNPYGLANLFFNQHYRNDLQTEKTLLANVDLTSNITSWLNLLVRANLNDRTTDFESKMWGSGVGFAGGSYSISNSVGRNSRLQVLLNGNRNFGEDFAFNFGAGGETQRYQPTKFTRISTVGGLKVPGQFTLGNSVDPVLNYDGGVAARSSKRLDAVYAYGDLTFRDMLTLNFSVRNDWSSTLLYPRDGHGDHSYFYPSVGLAFVFTELTRKSEKLDFLSFGKVRASLAYTGLGVDPWETSMGNYAFLGNYNLGNRTVPRYGFDGNTLGSLDIRNESTKEIEFGVDLRFFGNRLGIDASYYKKNTTNQLLFLQVPIESGVDRKAINAGNIQNKGIEIMLTATPIRTRNLEWTTSFNFARNRNKIIELAEGVPSYDLDLAFGNDMASVARAGKDYGTIITRYAYASYQKLDASGKPVDHPSNGQKLLKSNGSFYRTSEVGQPEKELGTMMEKFTLSNIQNFRYKNFNFGFQVDSKIGGLIASATHQYGSNGGNLKSTLFGRSAEFGGLPRRTYNASGAVTGTFDDGIIPEGVFADGISLRAPNGQTYDVGGMSYQEAVSKGIVEPVSARLYYARLTQWATGIREYSTFENSWVALREVSVGYTLPQAVATKLHLQNLRLNLVGRNLLYFYTTTKDSIHPEGGILSNRAGTFAEYGGVPYIRSLGVTLNAGF